MNPDDPRHGTNAGAVQHWKDDEKPCPACAKAAGRARKKAHLDQVSGRPRTVPLGQHAWNIIRTIPRNQLSAQTGINHDKLLRYETRGPDALVLRGTRDRIARCRIQWTSIGIQRRLQALSRLGWPMRIVADMTGRDVDSLKRLRRRVNPVFVRREVAEDVIDAYNRLQMSPPPAGKSSERTRALAAGQRWLPPLAWDNIDDPDEQPSLAIEPRSRLREATFDHAVVERLLAGDRVDATPAEKKEAMRRWVARGNSAGNLARLHRWNDGRYNPREAS